MEWLNILKDGSELITTPLAIIAALLIVGIVGDGIDRGVKNLSRKEGAAFFVSVLILVLAIAGVI